MSWYEDIVAEIVASEGSATRLDVHLLEHPLRSFEVREWKNVSAEMTAKLASREPLPGREDGHYQIEISCLGSRVVVFSESRDIPLPLSACTCGRVRVAAGVWHLGPYSGGVLLSNVEKITRGGVCPVCREEIRRRAVGDVACWHEHCPGPDPAAWEWDGESYSQVCACGEMMRVTPAKTGREI